MLPPPTSVHYPKGRPAWSIKGKHFPSPELRQRLKRYSKSQDEWFEKGGVGAENIYITTKKKKQKTQKYPRIQ